MVAARAQLEALAERHGQMAVGMDTALEAVEHGGVYKDAVARAAEAALEAEMEQRLAQQEEARWAALTAAEGQLGMWHGSDDDYWHGDYWCEGVHGHLTDSRAGSSAAYASARQRHGHHHRSDGTGWQAWHGSKSPPRGSGSGDGDAPPTWAGSSWEADEKLIRRTAKRLGRSPPKAPLVRPPMPPRPPRPPSPVGRTKQHQSGGRLTRSPPRSPQPHSPPARVPRRTPARLSPGLSPAGRAQDSAASKEALDAANALAVAAVQWEMAAAQRELETAEQELDEAEWRA